jgi:hypothetical protein
MICLLVEKGLRVVADGPATTDPSLTKEGKSLPLSPRPSAVAEPRFALIHEHAPPARMPVV